MITLGHNAAMTGNDRRTESWHDGRERQATLAWAGAVDAACRAVCRHRGSDPIDSTCALTPEQNALAWEANAALAAGVEALARACDREGLEWPEILEMALQERDESDRHRSATVGSMPAPRAGHPA